MLKTLQGRRAIAGKNKAKTCCIYAFSLPIVFVKHIYHFLCSWRQHPVCNSQHCYLEKAFLCGNRHFAGVALQAIFTSVSISDYRSLSRWVICMWIPCVVEKLDMATLCWVASVLFSSVQRYTLEPARSLCPRDSPGKNTWEGCHALLQGILLTQRWNPCLLCLLHWQVGSLPLAPPGELNTAAVSVLKYQSTVCSHSEARGLLIFCCYNVASLVAQGRERIFHQVRKHEQSHHCVKEQVFQGQESCSVWL